MNEARPSSGSCTAVDRRYRSRRVWGLLLFTVFAIDESGGIIIIPASLCIRTSGYQVIISEYHFFPEGV